MADFITACLPWLAAALSLDLIIGGIVAAVILNRYRKARK